MSITARFEWKPADCWVGLFVRRSWVAWNKAISVERWELWICILPMLPLHVTLRRRIPTPDSAE